ncbi:MAG: TetR/AcrR family transcriptional regulator [Spirochaetaceae bacterium]|jgi:AcrR family transcriptional regulator|nr:TetR/AcrR family transcriptional regulator [Spirochaetaceae bacterium]
MDTKPSRKVRYTRKALRESLIELMQTRPVSAISIKELCALADINRSTFYAHYRSPYEILQELEDALLETLGQMQSRNVFLTGKNALFQLIEEVLQFIIDNRNWIQVLLSEQGDIQFQRKLFSFIRQNEMIKFKNNEPIDELTKEYYLIYALNGSIALIQHWMKNGMDTPIEKMADMLVKLSWQE